MPGIIHDIPQKIDTADKKILKALFDDGRMIIADIAKKTGLRRDTVARRLKSMREEKIITEIVPIINPPALGLPNIAIMLIRTKTGNDEEKKQFLHKLIINKHIVHISKLIGKYDYYISILYEHTNHLNQIIEQIKTNVPNHIETFEVFQVAEEPKFEDMKNLL